MSSNSAKAGFSRRYFLIFLASLLGVFGLFVKKRRSIADAAPFVKQKEKWTASHFYDFLNALPTDVMLCFKKSLGILDADADEALLKGSDQDILDIQKHALWLSSNVLVYPFRDKTKLDYHELVTWVCGGAGIPEIVVQTAPTFALENELCKLFFVQKWDEQTLPLREEWLAKIDPNGAIKDKAAVATLSGAGALAVLSSTVAFKGFAFYTAMSTTIAATAGAVGVTLPFAAYTGASTFVGVLSGPVGWAIMGTAALSGVALAGRGNPLKTAAFIVLLHALKIDALIAAGVPEKDVFSI